MQQYARPWMLVPLLALGFVCLTGALRLRRVEYVTAIGGLRRGMASEAYSAGHHNESYEWLDQTRQMFAQGQWRVRYVDYENAPAGRDVNAASPYRWWLGIVALVRHVVSGSPIGPSVEWAALVADPLLLVVVGGLAVIFVARRFGILSAALLSAGLANALPLLPPSSFPGHLTTADFPCSWHFRRAHTPSRDRRWRSWRSRCSAEALVLCCGCRGWNRSLDSVPGEFPVLAGIGVGGLLGAWVSRPGGSGGPSTASEPLPWRVWAFGGAVTSLGAYLIEFFPSHMGSWELHSVHPVLGIAWLGGGGGWLGGSRLQFGGCRARMGLKGIAGSVLAVAALASIPAVLWLTHSPGFFLEDLSTVRLSILPESTSAPSLWSWLLQNGFTPMVWATRFWSACARCSGGRDPSTKSIQYCAACLDRAGSRSGSGIRWLRL